MDFAFQIKNFKLIQSMSAFYYVLQSKYSRNFEYMSPHWGAFHHFYSSLEIITSSILVKSFAVDILICIYEKVMAVGFKWIELLQALGSTNVNYLKLDHTHVVELNIYCVNKCLRRVPRINNNRRAITSTEFINSNKIFEHDSSNQFELN